MIWLYFLFSLQSFVYALLYVYNRVHMLVSVKWTHVYTSFLYQKHVYTPLCLNTVVYTIFCIFFSNISTHSDLFLGLFSLWVVNFCLYNFIILRAYYSEVSSALKRFGPSFPLTEFYDLCFGTQDFVQRFLIVLVL